MYLVTVPEGKKDIVDLNLAYQLGHENDDAATDILKHDDYTLVLKGTLVLELSNGSTLSGAEAFSKLGQNVLEQGLDSQEPTEAYRVVDSPRFEWTDEFGYSIDTRNTLSANPEIEVRRLEILLEDLYG